MCDGTSIACDADNVDVTCAARGAIAVAIETMLSAIYRTILLYMYM